MLAPALVPGPSNPYRPRRAWDTDLYRLVLDHHEAFSASYDVLYAPRYGEWRPYVGNTLLRYLDCGILANGFLRVRCTDCHHEVLVPWSCKRVCFCPSCGQRRSIEFGDFIDGEILEQVPYSHVTFTIPKLLRPIFLRDRRLLRELSACAWKTVRLALRSATNQPAIVPGATMAIATAGDLLNGHPHIHAIVSCGGWIGTAAEAPFLPWPSSLTAAHLEQLFRRQVLRLLTRRGRLNELTAERLLSWEHSGFSVYVGSPIQPWETESRRRLARYLLKAPISLERFRYDAETCRVSYGSHKRGKERHLGALDFLAEACVHVPDRGQHQVIYYGYHSNRSRGERRRQQTPTDDTQRETVPDSDALFAGKRKAFRMRWAALLERVWGVQALLCPICASPMEVVAGITDLTVAERILRHIGLFDMPRAPNIHDCPTPPATADGQTLLVFGPRLTPHPDSESAPDCEASAPDQDWPVDPPFADD